MEFRTTQNSKFSSLADFTFNQIFKDLDHERSSPLLPDGNNESLPRPASNLF